MKNPSLKLRLTAWYALFILIIVALMMGTLIINDRITSNEYYYNRLTDATESAVQAITVSGDLSLAETQSDTDVHVTVLSEDGTLLIGRRKFNADLRDDTLRIRGGRNNDSWYLLDRSVTLDGTRYWVRCYISSNFSEHLSDSLILLLVIMLPLLIFVVLLGGFRITRQALKPLDDIIQTASGISTSGDLHHSFSESTQYAETRQLAQTLDAMIERLARSIENEKQFISDASHELRTPFSVICTQSEYALLPGQSVEEKDAALEVILNRSRRSSDMLAQLLMLSRMDRQELPLQKEVVNLSELVENIADEMQLLADEKHIRIERDLDKNITLNCDEILIMRVMNNLIENAINYGRENGSVFLKLTKVPDGVRIEVRDNGIGISESDLPNIWRRFFRVNNFAGCGSGLGLSIVKLIVDAHGGAVTAQSELEKGTTFTVTLPSDL